MTEDYSLNLPEDTDLPFFAYGIFKPGQIAYSRIERHIMKPPQKRTAKREMFLRDGVPFISRDPSDCCSAEGFLFEFKKCESKQAYRTISESTSKKLYYWKRIDVEGRDANALIGKQPSRSNPIPMGKVGIFDGSNDPYFEEALQLIRDDKKEKLDFREMRDYFKIQRNYILLWAAIERYCSLRYGPNLKAINNEMLASEWFFQMSLKNHVPEGETRRIHRTDTLDRIRLDCNEPKESIDYYYTIRCNIAHRGKGPISEARIVYDSLDELSKIFQDVLDCTFDL